jgi:hypothetical protein
MMVRYCDFEDDPISVANKIFEQLKKVFGRTNHRNTVNA